MADDNNKNSQPSSPQPTPDPNEGPGKGKSFFDRAKAVAATGNFDYAIDMFIEGLNREPFNVEERRALREVAMHRKIAGGKPAGGLLGTKVPYKGGKTPKEAMLNNEFLLAKDFGNISNMLGFIRNADILGLKDVVNWIGQILKEANRTSKSPKVDIYVELADIYEHNEDFAKACDVINAAAELKPNDMELVNRGNQLAARATIKRGKFDEAASFQESIKDTAMTKQLLQEENLSRSEEYRLKAIASAKADYEANPRELQVIVKYSKTLADMDSEDYENQAIEVLKKGYEDTKVYRLKAGIGDIRMKQYDRKRRNLVEAAKADPKNKGAQQQYEQLLKEKLAFELEEFHERAEHMPTDLLVKYELGRRLFASKKFDEAIEVLQEAQANPKHKVDALSLLGRSFLTQGMRPEAIDTLKRSIDEYDLSSTGDKKAKELYYWYGRALQENGNASEAIDVYSKIVRWDIRFMDARKRLDELRGQSQQPT